MLLVVLLNEEMPDAQGATRNVAPREQPVHIVVGGGGYGFFGQPPIFVFFQENWIFF